MLVPVYFPGLNNGRSACSDLWPLCYRLLQNWRTPFQVRILAVHVPNSLRHHTSLTRPELCLQTEAMQTNFCWLRGQHTWWTVASSGRHDCHGLTLDIAYYLHAHELHHSRSTAGPVWKAALQPALDYALHILLKVAKVSMRSDGAAVQRRELETIC